MNTVPMITPFSINGMTGLFERPVYFLSINGSPTPNLVVKGEPMKKDLQDAQKSIAWSAKLMKNVNNSMVNTKIMTSDETDVFCEAVLTFFDYPSRYVDRVTIYRDDNIWVKMPLVPGLSDADYFTKESQVIVKNNITLNLYDIDKFKSGIAALLNGKVWIDLGKIVAVDVFTGNSDRFNVSTGEWTNKGNVMFLRNGLGGAIGLDTWDSGNFTPINSNLQFSNLNATGHSEALKTLIDPGYRRNFAMKCLTSLGKSYKFAMMKAHVPSMTFPIAGSGNDIQLVADNNISGCKIDTFFKDIFLEDFILGLQKGSERLKDYLANKIRQNQGGANLPTPALVGQNGAPARPTRLPGVRPTNQAPGHALPPGIMSRMQYLGWLR